MRRVNQKIAIETAESAAAFLWYCNKVLRNRGRYLYMVCGKIKILQPEELCASDVED